MRGCDDPDEPGSFRLPIIVIERGPADPRIRGRLRRAGSGEVTAQSPVQAPTTTGSAHRHAPRVATQTATFASFWPAWEKRTRSRRRWVRAKTIEGRPMMNAAIHSAVGHPKATRRGRGLTEAPRSGFQRKGAESSPWRRLLLESRIE